MADSENETNPRKKIKIDHNPGQNGDHSKAAETQANIDLPQAESSQVTTKDTEDIAGVTKSDATKENEEVNDEDPNDKDDAPGGTGNVNLKENIGNDKDGGKEDTPKESGNDKLTGNIDNDKDEDKDDVTDMTDGRKVGRRNMDIDISDAESDVSALSDMSSLSGEDSWKAAPAGPMAWVMRCMEDGVDPRSILAQVIPDEKDIPDVDDFTLWKLVVNLVSEPPPRKKLPDVNTLEDVIQLLQKCEKIMVLTGAGVSVSCGIPDFRSRNGIYARLAVDFPDLPDPQAMFDIRYFRRDQRPFFKFAKEIYPGQFEPSRSHKFIKLIEDHGKLLRNYTQNIDTLEQVAGIKNVIQCHGSFATATCMSCHHKCSSDDIKEKIMDQVIPMCPKCEPQRPLSVMKPDIVFFGESLPEEFHHQMAVDKDDCDLIIVIGSSLKVRPVALIPNSLPAHVPQILINKEHLRNLNFDVELLGDCDSVVGEICRRLGDDWTKIARKETMTQISMDELLTPTSSPKPSEKKSDKLELKTDEKECVAVQEQTVNTEKLGNVANTSTEVKENTNNSEESTTESDVKCQCNKDVTEDNETVKLETEKAGNSKVCKSGDESQAVVTRTEPSESGGKSVTQVETKKTEPETSETPKAKEVGNPDSNKSDETKIGQGKSANAETDSLSKETKNGDKRDDAKPGCSSEDNQKPSSTADFVKKRKMWGPYRQNVATRLGTNQFCFIPPCKYIFPEAEYFTWVKSDAEGDDDSEHGRDTTMDSSREFDLTHTSTDSSAMDGDVIDLTTDDEEDKGEAATEEPRKGEDDRDISKNTEVKTVVKDAVKDVQDTTAEIIID